MSDPVSAGPGNVKVYLTVEPPGLGQPAGPDRQPRSTTSSPTASASRNPTHLNVVELPDDTLPAVWAPELAAIMGSRVGDKSGIRLLANTIAHQWWGSEVSPAHPQRRLDHQRHGPLRRADVSGRRERQERPARRLAGRRRRRARLRHHSALQRRPPRPLLARVPVHDPRKGRHDLPHAALGDRRQGLPRHPQRRAQPIHRQLHPHRGLRESGRGAEPAAAHALLLRNGSTAPARPHSPTSTPSTAWATTRASAPSARSTRISTSSACRSTCASKPTAKP